MKIHAKQVPPEYQESPLFLIEEWPEDVFVFGNRDYNEHADRLNVIRSGLESIANTYDDMQKGHGWTDDLAYAIRCELPRDDGRSYTRAERLELVQLAQKYCDCQRSEENRVLCEVLKLITGIEWADGTIRGNCQGDWQEIIYPADYDRAWLRGFEQEYFNTGTEWLISEDGGEEGGCSQYCFGWNHDQIRAEIAEAAGVDATDVVLYEFTGWSQSPVYSEIPA